MPLDRAADRGTSRGPGVLRRLRGDALHPSAANGIPADPRPRARRGPRADLAREGVVRVGSHRRPTRRVRPSGHGQHVLELVAAALGAGLRAGSRGRSAGTDHRNGRQASKPGFAPADRPSGATPAAVRTRDASADVSQRYIRVYREQVPKSDTPSEPPRRAARVRGPRPAPRRSAARLRAAQAPHHRTRHLPRAVLRLALPGAAPARRLRLDPRDHRGRPAQQQAPPHHLRADRGRQGALPGPRRGQRPRRLGRRRLRRPLRLLLPHRGAGAPAHPRGPALAPRGAARQHPRRLPGPPRADGRLHPRPPAARRGARRARGPLARGAHRRRTPRGARPGPGGIRHPPQTSSTPQSTTTNNKE